MAAAAAAMRGDTRRFAAALQAWTAPGEVDCEVRAAAERAAAVLQLIESALTRG